MTGRRGLVVDGPCYDDGNDAEEANSCWKYGKVADPDAPASNACYKDESIADSREDSMEDDEEGSGLETVREVGGNEDDEEG